MNDYFEPTANRVRPRSFSELVGQDFFVSAIMGSLSRGERANAYLLSGPRGVGKTSAARLLALAINRPSNAGIDDLSYQGSDDIRLGRSLDVIEIDGASYTSVENVRNIREEVLYEPVQFRNKIYIIDEVHMLSHSAFNALLKTIEEPPKYVVFIFATTELQKIPATIRSRCQQYVFKPIHQNEIFKRLLSISKECHINFDEDALHWIAREAQGSLRDAYILFDQIASSQEKKVTLEGITKRLGLAGLDVMNELFVNCVEAKKKNVFLLLSKLYESGVSVEQIVFESAEYVRTVLLIQSGIEIQKFLGFSECQFDTKVLHAVNEKKAAWMLGILLKCHRNIKQSSQQQLELELTFFELCNVSWYVSPAELVERLENIKNDMCFSDDKEQKIFDDTTNSLSKNIEESYYPHPTEDGDAISTDDHPSLSWEKLLHAMQDIDEKSLVFLEDIKKKEDNTAQLLVLYTHDEFIYNMLFERKEIIRKNVKNIYGEKWDIVLHRSPPAPSSSGKKIERINKDKIEQDKHKKEEHEKYSEEIQSVLHVFGGTIKNNE